MDRHKQISYQMLLLSLCSFARGNGALGVIALASLHAKGSPWVSAS